MSDSGTVTSSCGAGFEIKFEAYCERDLIINNETYTKGQRQRILNYNKKDVDLTAKIFLKQVADLEKQLELDKEAVERFFPSQLFYNLATNITADEQTIINEMYALREKVMNANNQERNEGLIIEEGATELDVNDNGDRIVTFFVQQGTEGLNPVSFNIDSDAGLKRLYIALNRSTDSNFETDSAEFNAMLEKFREQNK